MLDAPIEARKHTHTTQLFCVHACVTFGLTLCGHRPVEMVLGDSVGATARGSMPRVPADVRTSDEGGNMRVRDGASL